MTNYQKPRFCGRDYDYLRKQPKSKFYTFLENSLNIQYLRNGKFIDKWEAFAYCKDAQKILDGKVDGLDWIFGEAMPPHISL